MSESGGQRDERGVGGAVGLETPWPCEFPIYNFAVRSPLVFD